MRLICAALNCKETFINSSVYQRTYERIVFFLISLFCIFTLSFVEHHQAFLTFALSSPLDAFATKDDNHIPYHASISFEKRHKNMNGRIESMALNLQNPISAVDRADAESSTTTTVGTVQKPGEVGTTRSITFLSSGYGSDDYDSFLDAIETCMKTLSSSNASDASMVNADPWPRYIGSMNVYYVFEPSAYIGAPMVDEMYYSDEENLNNLKCFFQSFPVITGIYLSCSVSSIQRLASFAPEQDLLVVIVNENTISAGTAGDGMAVLTTQEMYLPVLLIHYLSRALANLADEFSQGFPGETLETVPNCAKTLEEAAQRWSSFFPSNALSTDIVVNSRESCDSNDPDSTSLLASSHDYPVGCTFSNFYAPSTSCLMRSTAVDVLCPVCREAISLAFGSSTAAVRQSEPVNSSMVSLSLSLGQCPPPHTIIVARNQTVALFAGDFALKNAAPSLQATFSLASQAIVERKEGPLLQDFSNSTAEVEWSIGTSAEDHSGRVVHTGAYFHVPLSAVAANGSTFVTARIVDRSPFVRPSRQADVAKSTIVFELVQEAPSDVTPTIPSCYQRSGGESGGFLLGQEAAAPVFCPADKECNGSIPNSHSFFSFSYLSSSSPSNRTSVSRRPLVASSILPAHEQEEQGKVWSGVAPSFSFSLNTTSENGTSSAAHHAAQRATTGAGSGRRKDFFIPLIISGSCSILVLLSFLLYYRLRVSQAPREVLCINFLDRVLMSLLCGIILTVWVFSVVNTAESNLKNGPTHISVLLPVASSLLWLSAATTVFCAVNFLSCLMRWPFVCAICAAAEVLLGVGSFIFGGYSMLAALGGESKEFQDLFYTYWVNGAQKKADWVCPFQETHQCSGYAVSCFQINSTACISNCSGNIAMLPCGLAFTHEFSSQFDLLYSLTLTMSCLMVLCASLNVIYYLRFRQLSSSEHFRRTFRLDPHSPVLPITFTEARIARKSFNYAARHQDGKLSAEEALKFLDAAFGTPITNDEVKVISSKPEWTFDELMLTYFPFVQTSLTDPRMLAPDEAESTVDMLQLEKKQYKRLEEFEEASGCLSPEALQTLFQENFGSVFMPEKSAILSLIREAAKDCSDKDVCRGLSPSELEGLRILWVAVHPAVCGPLELQELALLYAISHSPHQLETPEALEKWKNELDVAGRGVIGWREFCYPYAKVALLRKARRTLKYANCSLPPEMVAKDFVLDKWGPTYSSIFLPYEKEIPLERLAVAVMQRWSATLGCAPSFFPNFPFMYSSVQQSGKKSLIPTAEYFFTRENEESREQAKKDN